MQCAQAPQRSCLLAWCSRLRSNMQKWSFHPARVGSSCWGGKLLLHLLQASKAALPACTAVICSRAAQWTLPLCPHADIRNLSIDPLVVSIVVIKSLSTLRAPLLDTRARNDLLSAAMGHGYNDNVKRSLIRDVLQRVTPSAQGTVLQVRRGMHTQALQACRPNNGHSCLLGA